MRTTIFFTAEAQRARRDFFTPRSQRLCGAFIFHRRGAEGAERFFHSAFSAALRCVLLPPVYFKPLSQMCQNVSGFMPVLLRNDHDRTA